VTYVPDTLSLVCTNTEINCCPSKLLKIVYLLLYGFIETLDKDWKPSGLYLF